MNISYQWMIEEANLIQARVGLRWAAEREPAGCFAYML
jgi:hypothetical protein